jgi:RimJ/RimL family protein N-acetyltransferase
MTLVTPFPARHTAAVWKILLQFPRANFDDYGPKSEEAFIQELINREQRGEVIWCVEQDGNAIGVIGYSPMSPRTGAFHGIAFDKSVHGSGVPRCAVLKILETLFSQGITKVSAGYFADNQRIRHFLKALGARDEGYLREQTMRDDKPVDMRLIAFYAPSVELKAVS